MRFVPFVLDNEQLFPIQCAYYKIVNVIMLNCCLYVSGGTIQPKFWTAYNLVGVELSNLTFEDGIKNKLWTRCWFNGIAFHSNPVAICQEQFIWIHNNTPPVKLPQLLYQIVQ